METNAAEKLTGTTLRAEFLQIEKISYITNTTKKKTILICAGEVKVPPRGRNPGRATKFSRTIAYRHP